MFGLLRSSFMALVLLVFFATLARSDSSPLPKLQNILAGPRCVTGKVLRVEAGDRGTHFLDFSDDYRVCPFTVVGVPPAI